MCYHETSFPALYSPLTCTNPLFLPYQPYTQQGHLHILSTLHPQNPHTTPYTYLKNPFQLHPDPGPWSSLLASVLLNTPSGISSPQTAPPATGLMTSPTKPGYTHRRSAVPCSPRRCLSKLLKPLNVLLHPLQWHLLSVPTGSGATATPDQCLFIACMPLESTITKKWYPSSGYPQNAPTGYPPLPPGDPPTRAHALADLG
jgi:hypothetical protein